MSDTEPNRPDPKTPAEQDDRLVHALMPTVEKIIRVSVKKDIATFADALFPVIGPAIRKAIAEAFRTMIQSLNSAMEQSFSLQGLKWRLASVRTGIPFAQIVLLNNLVYRVEQVFLIHKETGLLLQHVSAEDEAFQDADLVSGMLTAIQDFVRDSFHMEKSQSLATIQVGEITVWIEQGPVALLAGAIRGNAQEDLRVVFQDALEQIHLETRKELARFDGDSAPFDAVRYHLEACIKARYREKKRRTSPLLLVLSAAGIIGLVWWGVGSTLGHYRLAAYVENLTAEPGIVVTAVEKRDGKIHINGLRDPLAKDPAALLSHTALSPGQFIYNLAPYQALQPDFVLERAQTVLRPPENVAFSLVNGTLVARGSAPYRWVAAARNLALSIAGIDRFDDSQLVITELKDLEPPTTVALSLHDGVLRAVGSSPHRWIVAARKKALQIPGVLRFDDTDLEDIDLLALAAHRADLEKEIIIFEPNTSAHSPEFQNPINRALRILNRFIDRSLELNRQPVIDIIGHTDTSGSPSQNMVLSRQRADQVRQYLVVGGIEPDFLRAVGAGTGQPVRPEVSEPDNAWNRSVTFRVLQDLPETGADKP